MYAVFTVFLEILFLVAVNVHTIFDFRVSSFSLYVAPMYLLRDIR